MIACGGFGVIHFHLDGLIGEVAMSAAIAVRDDYDAEGLRVLAGKTKDANQARRLLAFAAVCDGMDREEAARIGGMDRQTLRDWVHRFNEQGPDGLVNRKPSGRPSKLSAEQKEELVHLVEAGPDPRTHGVVGWRLAWICSALLGSASRSISRR